MFKTTILLCAGLLLLCSAAFAQDLYKVSVTSKSDVQELVALDGNPVVRLIDGYLVLIDDAARSRLQISDLKYELVESNVSRSELAVDNRLDRANIEKYQVVFEQDDLRVLRVNAQAFRDKGQRLDLTPLADQQIPLSYIESAALRTRGTTAGIDLDSLITLVRYDSLYSYLNRYQDFYRRNAGSDSMYAASDWTFNKFQSFGYDSVYIDNFSAWIDGNWTPLENVVATKVGTAFPNRQIVVGAHLDAVPDSPGADDNASGSAAVLEIARALSDIDTYCTFIFITFDGEEYGLHGSWHYANSASANDDSILYMFNMDMIGFEDNAGDAKLYHGEDNTYSRLWADLAPDLVSITGHLAGASGSSDHYPFWQNGYQVTFLHEYEFSDVYHSEHDSISYMNVSYMTRMVKASLATLYSVMMIETGPRLFFEYPDGLPEFVIAGQESTFTLVLTTENAASVVPGGVSLHYSIDGLPYVTQPVAETAPNEYEVILPAVACTHSLEYFLSAEEASTGRHYDGGAENPYVSYPATEVTVALEDNFETDQGWTVSGGALAGYWERGVPVNDPNWDYDPETDGDGSGSCYLTGNYTGDSDVDEGTTELYSPVFDLSGGGAISYDYYLNLSDESTNWDRLQVDIKSFAGGGEWKQVALHNTSSGTMWRHNLISADDLAAAGVTLTDSMQLRFSATDLVESIVEAAVDHVLITQYDCAAQTPAVPTLIAPADGITINDALPQFDWSAVAAAEQSYTLQYSTDETFSESVTSIYGLTESQFSPVSGGELDEGEWFWHVQTVGADNIPSGYQSQAFSFSVELWTCGDADENELVNVSDAVFLISYIFGGGPAPQPLEAGDVDCNLIVNISDAVYLISYIFGGGPEPCADCA